jgi:hypothetical protein
MTLTTTRLRRIRAQVTLACDLRSVGCNFVPSRASATEREAALLQPAIRHGIRAPQCQLARHRHLVLQRLLPAGDNCCVAPAGTSEQPQAASGWKRQHVLAPYPKCEIRVIARLHLLEIQRGERLKQNVLPTSRSRQSTVTKYTSFPGQFD